MDSLKLISWYETFPDKEGQKIYAETVLEKQEIKTENTFEISGMVITAEDFITRVEDKVEVVRRVRAKKGKKESTKAGNGIAFGIDFLFEEQGRQFRYGIPSCRYSSGQAGKHTYMEERLTAPFVMAYDGISRTAVSAARTGPPRYTGREERKTGDSRFLHKTEAGSLGYEWREGRGNMLCVRWPYEELEKSVALDSNGTPVQAFYPLDGETWEIELRKYLC